MYQDILTSLKESPDAVLIVNQFQEYLKSETEKRKEFYDLIHENIKAEFINGEIVLHSPVRMKHLMVSSNVSYELMKFVKDHDLGFMGIERMMITLSRNNYEPDIVFYIKEVSAKFTHDQKLFPAPDLVVEILSESTRKNDYGIKFRDYAAHNVGEYWIIDADAETIEQYVLIETQFELQKKLTKNDVLTCLVINGLKLDLGKIFN
jgi:Uma2 family endonuclease